MREDMERMYGAELRWLRSICWFAVSMCLVMMAADGPLPCLAVIYLNGAVSAWQLRKVRGMR